MSNIVISTFLSTFGQIGQNGQHLRKSHSKSSYHDDDDDDWFSGSGSDWSSSDWSGGGFDGGGASGDW